MRGRRSSRLSAAYGLSGCDASTPAATAPVTKPVAHAAKASGGKLSSTDGVPSNRAATAIWPALWRIAATMHVATAPKPGMRDAAALPANASAVPPRLYMSIIGEPNRKPEAITFTTATAAAARVSIPRSATTTATFARPSFTPGSATGSGIIVSI